MKPRIIFETRIVLYYLAGALLAWGVPFLMAALRPKSDDGMVNFGNALTDMLTMYYAILGFLILAIVTGLVGFLRSGQKPRKNAFLLVMFLSGLSLAVLLITTVSF
jgi:hypothetical protein